MDTQPNLITKVASSTWFVTLMSTMIGVVAGFYLTDFNEKRKLNQGKKAAIEKVSQELESNHKQIAKLSDSLKIYYPQIEYVLTKVDGKSLEIIIDKDSLDSFVQKSRKVFTFFEAKSLNAREIDVSGTFEFNLVSNFIMSDLSHIVWDTYKQSHFTTITAFDCLIDVEVIYNAQKNVNASNKEWAEALFQLSATQSNEEVVAAFRIFMEKWKNLMLKQDLLLSMYKHNRDYSKRFRMEIL